MTTSVGRGAIDQPAAPSRDRTIRATTAARFVARVAGSLWLRDRAVAELRWGAVTLAAMAALAMLGKVLDPAETGFDNAIILFTPVAIGAIVVGWSSQATRVMAVPFARVALGPVVVGLAFAATGPIDLITLITPSAAPLAWLALAFAAITAGFPVALAMMIGSSLAVYAAHIQVVGPADVVQDEFIVGTAVVALATTGMYVVTRIATEAEARATRLAARSRARVDTLEALDRIDRRFDGSRPFGSVIQSVVDDVSREFEIALVSMYVPIEDGRLSMVGVAGYHSPFHVIEIGLGVIGRAASERTTQFVPDVLVDPDYRAARDDVRSEIATPIVHDGELLGVVNFEGTLARPMTTAHVALAELLARSIASSLRSARLDQERRDRLHAIERVLDVSRGLVSDLDRGRTVRAVVDAAADLLSAESVYVAGRDSRDRFIVEHERLCVDGEAAAGPTGAGRILDAGDVAALDAIRSGAAVVVEGDRSTLALPIEIDGEVAGVLVAVRPSGAPSFGALERRIAELLITQVAVALQNADRHARVSDAAVRDPLTGLLNRRFFDEAVESAFATARRSGTALSLVVLDLDRFSAVNNTHGHSTGDAVLRRVARAIAGAVRIGDIAARYGGEEFVVIAPGADTAEAVAVAERIRAAVAAGSDGTSSADTPAVAVTISAGVATLLGDELDGRALFRAADSALLAAKRAGRDRVAAV